MRPRAGRQEQELARQLKETRTALGASKGARWKPYPDAAARLAFLYRLRTELEVDVWHMNLYFVAAGLDTELAGVAPGSEDEWQPVIDDVRAQFALDASELGRHIRREFVIEPR